MSSADRAGPELSLVQRWSYAIGNFSSMMTGYGIVTLAPYVFNLSLGVDPALIGVALAVPRFVDLFTDPAAGYLSDRLAAKLSRQAFVGWGALLSALCFAAVWWFPSGLTQHGYFLWLLTFSCATAVGWSFLSIPWQALGFELTSDYHERTRLMAASTLILGLAGIIYGWSYAASQLPIFGGTLPGARWVGSIMAALILGTGLITTFFCAKPASRAGRPAPAVSAGRPASRGFGASLGRIVRSRPFVCVAAAVILMCIGVFSVTGIGPYIAIYFVEAGDQAKGAILIGASSTAWQGTCLLLSGSINRFTRGLGKSRALILFLGIALLGNVAKWFCYNPAIPWLFVIPSILFAAGFTGLWTLAPSMVADICDFEETKSGVRDDGMFAGFYTWMIKLGSTIAFAAGGFLINLTGFAVAHGSNQGEATILRMRLVDFTVPAISIVLSIWLLTRYRLTEAVMVEVRQKLDRRPLDDTALVPDLAP